MPAPFEDVRDVFCGWPVIALRGGLIRHHAVGSTRLIEDLDLRKPIFQPTAAYGHFGREEFSWESTARAKDLASALGI